MNCLKFHCPAGLPQLPAGRLGLPTAGGSRSRRSHACVCFRKHLLQFGILGAASTCTNSLKQMSVEAGNLRWGL